jgi:hypothetical protein
MRWPQITGIVRSSRAAGIWRHADIAAERGSEAAAGGKSIACLISESLATQWRWKRRRSATTHYRVGGERVLRRRVVVEEEFIPRTAVNEEDRASLMQDEEEDASECCGWAY